MRSLDRVVMVLVLLLVAGCAGVPTSGPVEHHQPQQTGASRGVQVAPLPPADGATQLLVVEGFLHAMGTYQSDYQVARQYLTTQAAQRWQPESGVQVYADGFPPAETDQSVVLVAPLNGTISANGSYRIASGGLRHDFGLVKNEAGQWRISNPPQGLLVSRYLFSTGFEAVDVHFAASDGAVLVPEPRYFPAGSQALARAVAALVSGPSDWLAPLTATTPAGLKVISVTLDSSGIVHVDLAGATEIGRERRTLLLAQIVYTLSSLERVRSVVVESGGERWSGPNGRMDLTPLNFPDLDPGDATASRSVFAARTGKLQRQISQDNWLDFVDAQQDFSAYTGLAISRSGGQWAAIGDGATRLYSGSVLDKGARMVATGKGLLRPFYSRTGELWSPTTTLSGLRVYRDGQAVTVSVQNPPPGRLVAAALAPDGDRLAVLVTHSGTTTLGLLRVQRQGKGVVINGWAPIELNLTSVGAATGLDVGWQSVTALAVLQIDTDAKTSVMETSQDGAVQSDLGPSDATGLVSMVVVPGRPALALSRTGSLYRFDGDFNWTLTLADVDAMAYPG